MKFPKLLLLATALCLVAPPAHAQSAVVYAPKEGDVVVLFTLHLVPETYETGRAIIFEGFSEALDRHNAEDGGDRLTYWLEDRENATVLAVSFFHSDASVEAWLESPHRLEVLATLDPHLVEPVFVERLTTVGFHHTWNPHATGHEARGGSSHPRH